jgi:hypothetical protein
MGLRIAESYQRWGKMADQWVSDARNAKTVADLRRVAERVMSEWRVPHDEWKLIVAEIDLRGLRWLILDDMIKNDQGIWQHLDKQSDLALEIIDAKFAGIGIGMQHEFEREQARWKELEKKLQGR